MKSTPKVIVVIVNYNKPFETLRCVDAILKNRPTPMMIIVVDNASMDNSVSILRQHQRITLICNQENIGGSGGFNTGIQAALVQQPDYVWLLDDDAYPDNQYLHYALQTFQSYPDTVVVGAQLLDIDDKNMIVELGANINWRHLGIVVIKRHQARVTQHYTLKVEYVAACCMLISRQTLDTVGMLNSFYFLHWDDIEFGYQVNQHGLTVRVNTRAIAYHKLYDQVAPPSVRYYDIRNAFHFYLVASNNKYMKWRILSRDIFWLLITRPFSKRPLDIYVLYKVLFDLMRGKMGKLDSSAIWSYKLNQSHHLILSCYLSLSERIIIANNLNKQGISFEILVRNHQEVQQLGQRFPIRQIRPGLMTYLSLLHYNLSFKNILISTGYYNTLDVFFLRRAYYDGQAWINYSNLK